MSQINYAIKIYDIGIPLKRSIGIFDIMAFVFLLRNKNSRFYKWYYSNINFIKIKSQILSDNDIDEFLQIPLKEMIKSLEVLDIGTKRKTTTSSLFDDFVDKNKYIMVGGTKENDDKRDIIIGALYFLFNRDVYNDILFKKIIDIPDKKDNIRQIYITSIDNDEYILKLTKNREEYIAETNIYIELNNIMENDNRIKDKIIKIYSNGKIRKNNNYELQFDQHIVSINSVNTTNIYNSINNLLRGEEMINYSVLEYNPQYETLSNLKKNSNIDICYITKEILKTIYILNNEYDFIHFDLHLNNILVNPIFNTFKIFDFDTSTTLNNYNNYAFIRLLPYYDMLLYGSDVPLYDYDFNLNISYKDLKKIGLSYDFLRLMHGVSEMNVEKCKNMDKLLNIFNLYIDTIYAIYYDIITEGKTKREKERDEDSDYFIVLGYLANDMVNSYIYEDIVDNMIKL